MTRIVVDSACDMTKEAAEAKGFAYVPLNIALEGELHQDGITLQRNDLYRRLQENGSFPKTSQPTPHAFLEAFLAAKEAGEEVVCITLASKLSGTYQSALLARSMADYPRIFVVDSCTATYAVMLLADYARAMADLHLPAEAIVAELERVKPLVRVAAALDTLEYLQRGGRVSKAAAALGDAAKLKPTIEITREGGIAVTGKCLGQRKAMSRLLDQLESNPPDTSFPLYTVYTYGEKNCARFEEKLTERGIVPTARLQVGATIGCHIGPGAFGVAYVARA